MGDFRTTLMPTLLFLRHGQADHNVGAEQDGPTAYKNPIYRDPHLTEKGQLQVEMAARSMKHLIGTSRVYVYSSPLVRTIETANIVCETLKDNIVDRVLHDSLLEQLHLDHCCNWRKQASDLQTMYSQWDSRLLAELPPPHVDGESDESVKRRIESFLTLVKRLHTEPNSIILLVSHHDTLKFYLQKKLENAEFEVEMYEA